METNRYNDKLTMLTNTCDNVLIAMQFIIFDGKTTILTDKKDLAQEKYKNNSYVIDVDNLESNFTIYNTMLRNTDSEKSKEILKSMFCEIEASNWLGDPDWINKKSIVLMENLMGILVSLRDENLFIDAQKLIKIVETKDKTEWLEEITKSEKLDFTFDNILLYLQYFKKYLDASKIIRTFYDLSELLQDKLNVGYLGKIIELMKLDADDKYMQLNAKAWEDLANRFSDPMKYEVWNFILNNNKKDCDLAKDVSSKTPLIIFIGENNQKHIQPILNFISIINENFNNTILANYSHPTKANNEKTATQIRQEYKKEIEEFFEGDITLEKMEEITKKLETCKVDEQKELKTQIRLIQDYLFSRL